MGKIYGINLGNWLVLEKWMDKEPFEGTTAEDETDLCIQLRDEKYGRLQKHRDMFITENDFEYIKNHGFNTVRLPIPHFIFDDCSPYVGCIKYLDIAMDWAGRNGLKVLIDLHTAPDSQNGFDNGGICGVCKWHTNPENIQRTLDILEKLAIRYHEHPALYGIEMLNEPVSEELWMKTRKNYLPSDKDRAKGSYAVPLEALFDFYTKGYHILRRHLDEDKAVMFHDGFRLKSWKDFMRGPEYKNVVLDTHLYLGMNVKPRLGRDCELADYIKTALGRYEDDILEMSAFFPVVIGEWCLAHYPAGIDKFSSQQKYFSYRMMADAQLYTWEKAAGWFFWSYKLREDVPGWDLRKCIKTGWFPDYLNKGDDDL
jgi:glucan 1,3-beta-glucosidase